MAEAERKEGGSGGEGGGHNQRRRNLPPRQPPTPPRPPSTAVPSQVAPTIVYGRGAGANNYAKASSDMSSLSLEGGCGHSNSDPNYRVSDASADGGGGGRTGGGGRRLRWSDATTDGAAAAASARGGWGGTGSRLGPATDAGDRHSSYKRAYRPSTLSSGGVSSGGLSSGGLSSRGLSSGQMDTISEVTNNYGSAGGDDAASNSSSRRGRVCCSCGGPPTASSARARTQHREGRIMEILTKWNQRRAWVGTVLLCTAILIFGPPFQILAMPPSSDFAVAVIFSIVAVILMVDIVLWGIVDPNYFLWYCPLCDRCTGCNKERTCCYFHAKRLNRYPIREERGKPRHCQMGSFVFWLDLISVLSFLPEIQFINPHKYDIWYSEIGIGEDDLPSSGLAWDLAMYVPLETILVVGRAARLGKFIRSSTVVLVSKSFYSLTRQLVECNFINPFRLCRDGSLVNAIRSVIRRVCACMLCVDGEADAEAVRASVTIQRWWRAVTGGDGAFPSAASGRQSAFSSVGTPSSIASSGSTAAAATKNTSLIRESVRRSTRAMAERRSARKARRSAKKRRYRSESQVGTAMRELTGRRVGVGIIVALILSFVFTYSEPDEHRQDTMVMLHYQTRVSAYAARALDAAKRSSVPDLYEYHFANGTTQVFQDVQVHDLRDMEKLNVTVMSATENVTTSGLFEIRAFVQDLALTQIVVDVFVLIIWTVGVLSFAGPVMTLVVTPIERMVRLLSMLTRDPLGYQSTPRFKQLMDQEYEIVKSTHWEEDVLKGMETSFLMSTILRIGSLMRVGFGSAGVEIIRNCLQKKGSRYDGFVLNQRGSTVSCIFLFCDIRQFTDATEALQEEVFVFTNKIAAVVHSICNSYGGSANKNVGDAFLLSWRLDDAGATGAAGLSGSLRSSGHWGDDSHHGNSFSKGMDSPGDQADKALYSVVKISMALYDDDKFLEDMSSLAKEKLLEKTSRRKGPVVQMGCGLHAGTAVQGPIGSQRKIDPTYVAESVERAEVLESLTKRYGLKVLMSESFHELLSVNTGRRCRKIDQLLLNSDEDCLDVLDVVESGETMEVFTFDMDIDSLHVDVPRGSALGSKEHHSEQGGLRRRRMSRKGSFTEGSAKFAAMSKSLRSTRRPSFTLSTTDRKAPSSGIIEMQDRGGVAASDSNFSPRRIAAIAQAMHGHDRSPSVASTDVHALYDASVWISQEIRTIRKRYTDGLFFQTFNSGLNSYFRRDWDHARSCFLAILERFEDGPSRYFLNIIEENNCIPPAGFNGYGSV